MANPDYAHMPIRLSKLEMGRLEADAKKRRISKNEFVRRALAVAFSDSDGGKYVPDAIYEGANSTSGEEPRRAEKPTSMGIRSLFAEMKPAETDSSPTAATTPIVVNNNIGPTASAGGSLVENLANYVVSGRDFERDRHFQVAVEVIKANTATDEEREKLARQLDEAVEKKGKKSNDGTNIMQAARMTFDKVSSFFRED